MNDETLGVLLIEDNPGDVRLIEEMLRDAETLLSRIDAADTTAEGSRLYHEQSLADGLERLDDDVDIDVVLLDLGLPDSTGLDTLTAVTGETAFVPVIVLTGLDDGEVGLRAIQHGAQDYLVKHEVTRDLLVRSIHYAIERTRQERDRAERRQQLDALNRLNLIVQDVTHAVITTSTRDGLERAVCEKFAGSELFHFAWFGEVDRVNDRVVPRVAAGVEAGYLDNITVTVDGGDTAEGPAGRAVRTRTTQVMQNIRTDPAFEPWREDALERGYRSSAAVPIEYEGLLYGVLNVYAGSPNVFTESVVEILSRLGNVIGHAITAIERREALTNDLALELEFQVADVATDLVALTADGGAFEFEDVIRTHDGLVTYGRVEGISRDAVQEAAARSTFVDDLRLLSPGDDEYDVELVTTAVGDLVDVIGTHGGRVGSATIRDRTFRFAVEFPPGRTKRPLIELIEEHCPNARPVAQRTVERSPDAASDFRSEFRNRLTERQYTALKTAYLAGHFEWPRRCTGEAVADRLGISSPTFNEHKRIAIQKILETVFETADDPASE